MGKASRWFRSLLGLKKSSDHSIPPKEKRRWSFVNSYRGGSSSASVMARQNPDANERAEVVRLTSSGRSADECSPAYVSGSLGIRQDFAALKIQSAFRRYLARRALKALRSIVKIQALVRGHIVRKKTAAWLPQSSAASSRGGKRSPFMKIDQSSGSQN